METRRYHITLVSGQERDVTAADVEFTAIGSVEFLNSNGARAVVYAPGTWVCVEVESRDDRE